MRKFLAVLAVLTVMLSALAVLPAAGLAPATAADCTTQHNSVIVTLSGSKYPGTTDHLTDAIAAGQPSLLHIDRPDTDLHRSQSLAGIPTKTGYDRDEYPPAVSREGGTGADVRYVASSDNRGAGSSMGAQLSGWCDGQPFRIQVGP